MPRPRREQEATLFPVENRLYCGDNLEILRLYQPDESVDLIYLDPPFKKQASYNVLFKELSGRKAAAQIKAFADTWTWDEEAIATYREIIEGKDERLSQAMQAFHTFLGSSEMMAYLAMMAPRLMELRRVLKPTGSIYLHCDPAASHYLKMLMDAVFGAPNFRNEIVWHYSGWNKRLRHHFERRTDTLLFFGAGPSQRFNSYARPWASVEEYVKVRKQKIRKDDEGRLYVLSDAGGGKRARRYLDEAMQDGVYVDNLWDIDKLNNSSTEKLGYPTQKPVALLERIILASSNPGDVVLDPFCGCGTTIDAAHKWDRRWIGIDITHKATDVIEARLLKEYGGDVVKTYSVHWDPVSPEDAAALAERKPHAFEDWAVRRLGATGSGKRGADQGIDGRIRFHDEPDGPTRQIIVSVKAGHIGPAHVRDLRGVMGREKADIGVLVSMREPTISMRREASGAGDYVSVVWDEKYPRIQLLTAEGLLAGKGVRYPRGDKLAARMALDREAAIAQPELSEPQMVARSATDADRKA